MKMIRDEVWLALIEVRGRLHRRSYQGSFVPETTTSPGCVVASVDVEQLPGSRFRAATRTSGGQGRGRNDDTAACVRRHTRCCAILERNGKARKGKEWNGKARKGKNKLGAVGVGRGWPPFSSLAAKRTAPTNRQTPPPASPPLVLQRVPRISRGRRRVCTRREPGEKRDRLKNRGSPASPAAVGSEVSPWVPVQGDTYLTVRPRVCSSYCVTNDDQRRPTTHDERRGSQRVTHTGILLPDIARWKRKVHASACDRV